MNEQKVAKSVRKGSSSKDEIYRKLSVGQRPHSAKMPVAQKRKPRPSSARWAELSSTKGMHEETKLKVNEIKKLHASKKDSDLSHIREFKSLSVVLDKQRAAE